MHRFRAGCRRGSRSSRRGRHHDGRASSPGVRDNGGGRGRHDPLNGPERECEHYLNGKQRRRLPWRGLGGAAGEAGKSDSTSASLAVPPAIPFALFA
jgi:hypothetical protein